MRISYRGKRRATRELVPEGSLGGEAPPQLEERAGVLLGEEEKSLPGQGEREGLRPGRGQTERDKARDWSLPSTATSHTQVFKFKWMKIK